MPSNLALPSGTPGVLEEAVDFRRPGGGRLRGTVAFPEGSPASKLAVVTLHGWGGNRCGPHRIFARLCRALAGAGVPALRFDLGGRGESDGEASSACLDDMIVEALAAAEYLHERFGAERVSYCGLCSGGNVAIGASTLRPAARLALLSTLPFSPRSGGAARRKTLALLRQYLAKALSPRNWLRLLRGEIDAGAVAGTLAAAGAENAAERKLKDSARDIMSAFGAAKTPCLFVYGGADPEADPALEHYRGFCSAHGIPCSVLTVPEANHNFYSCEWSHAAEAAVLDFLTRDSGV